MNSGFAAKIKTIFPFFPAALVSRVQVLFLGGCGQGRGSWAEQLWRRQEVMSSRFGSALR